MKPTRVCHQGDSIWNTLQTLCYAFIFIIGIIWTFLSLNTMLLFPDRQYIILLNLDEINTVWSFKHLWINITCFCQQYQKTCWTYKILVWYVKIGSPVSVNVILNLSESTWVWLCLYRDTKLGDASEVNCVLNSINYLNFSFSYNTHDKLDSLYYAG